MYLCSVFDAADLLLLQLCQNFIAKYTRERHLMQMPLAFNVFLFFFMF